MCCPGLFGRDPWKSADITAFGYMRQHRRRAGRSWLAPTVGGLPRRRRAAAVLDRRGVHPAAGPWLDPALAARIPFALLLVLDARRSPGTRPITWRAPKRRSRCRSPSAARPTPADYARAIADGALLALIASLGLLQLGHETTPELAQLARVALFSTALAASCRSGRAQGAPSRRAGAAGAGRQRRAEHRDAARPASAAVICRGRADAEAAAHDAWVGAQRSRARRSRRAVAARRLGLAGSARYRHRSARSSTLLRQLAWFTWPAWPLALWTLWRWRRRLLSRHIVVPLGLRR